MRGNFICIHNKLLVCSHKHQHHISSKLFEIRIAVFDDVIIFECVEMIGIVDESCIVVCSSSERSRKYSTEFRSRDLSFRIEICDANTHESELAC